MAGLFKMRDAYNVVGRPFLYPEKALDFTLNLQHNNGEFGYGGDMCINWDAMEVLRILDKQLEGTYRRDDIVQAGNLLAQCLLQKYRKSDGGFAFHKNYCLTMHNSIRISAPYPESDMLGTYMCWISLSYADEWNKRSFEFSSVY